MRNVKRQLTCLGVLAGVVAMPVRPAAAWIACGHFYRPPVVVCHTGPCYAGIGAAAVVGFAAGAAVASRPVVVAPSAVVVAPPPVVVTTPTVYPPLVGDRVSVLPIGAQEVTVRSVQYYLSSGTWYRPFFGSNGVYYEVVPAP